MLRLCVRNNKPLYAYRRYAYKEINMYSFKEIKPKILREFAKLRV